MTEQIEQNQIDSSNIEKDNTSRIMSKAQQDMSLMRMAHQIIQDNKARPDVVKKHVSAIREKLQAKKLQTSNTFQRTQDSVNQLAKLAGIANMIKAGA